MHAVGIEGREADLRRLLQTQVEDDLPAQVLDDQFAATVDRGQREHYGCEHARDYLGVAMVDEEATGVVDEKLVEVGFDRLAHAEPERGFGNQAGERFVPLTSADPNMSGFDLPGSADAAIDQCLLPSPMRGGPGDSDELLGLHRQHRKGDPADAIDIDGRG